MEVADNLHHNGQDGICNNVVQQAGSGQCSHRLTSDDAVCMRSMDPPKRCLSHVGFSLGIVDTQPVVEEAANIVGNGHDSVINNVVYQGSSGKVSGGRIVSGRNDNPDSGVGSSDAVFIRIMGFNLEIGDTQNVVEEADIIGNRQDQVLLNVVYQSTSDTEDVCEPRGMGISVRGPGEGGGSTLHGGYGIYKLGGGYNIIN